MPQVTSADAAKVPKGRTANRRALKPPSGFRRDIEGLRAIAVLSVLAYHLHIPGTSGGFVGVDVFFVISGYLITGHLVSEAAEGQGVRFVDFYARRFRRILPAATATIVATVAAGMLFLDPLDTVLVGDDARSASLFYSNIFFWSQSTDYLAEARTVSLFQQYWSLSLEEQFYIVWPIIIGLTAWMAARSRRRQIRQWLAAVLLVLVVASFVLSVDAASNDPVGGFFLLQNRWWELGLGALLAVSAQTLRSISARKANLILSCGLLMILLSVIRYNEQTTWPGSSAAVPVLGAALVIWSGVHTSSSLTKRLISSYPMGLVGRYSYSIYLWHWPLVVLVAKPQGYSGFSVVAVVLATLFLAALSYHLVEAPFRVSKVLQNQPRLTLAVGGCLIAIGALAPSALGFLAPPLDAGRPVDAQPHQAGQVIQATDFVPSNLVPSLPEGTNDKDPNAARNVSCERLGDCTSGDPDSPFKVVIFGDSHADHWAPAVRAFAESKGGRFDRLTKGGCNLAKRTCKKFHERAWAAIDELSPTMLVIAGRYASGSYPEDMDEVVRRAPKGTEVVLISRTPSGPKSTPHCLAENLEQVSFCEPRWPQNKMEETNKILQQVAATTGARFVDVTSLLCVNERCPAIADNILVYRDQHHLTTAFVESRAKDLAQLLDR